ncbi:hypothetical protein [Wenyingzhuangia sp. IMCC45467]
MKAQFFFILGLLFIFKNAQAQKIINNPDHLINNTNAAVTKIELTTNETIIHFHIRGFKGHWISIPKETYIEDSSGKGEKLYVTKTDGISLTGKNYFKESEEIRFKVFFPPLAKDTKRINYGESNAGGNWFIYKLDLRKDGTNFINNLIDKKTFTVNKFTTENKLKNKVVNYNINQLNLTGNTIFPEQLPKDFFGNWYDKYGTLLLIATPDFLVSDQILKHYLHIQKIGTNKFKIYTSSNLFEILNLENDEMTIRTNRLIKLHKKSSYKKIPKFLQGKWLHNNQENEITVTDHSFFYYNKQPKQSYNQAEKSKVIYVASSNNDNLIWIVLYQSGNYQIYQAKKINNEYFLQPRGHADDTFSKLN